MTKQHSKQAERRNYPMQISTLFHRVGNLVHRLETSHKPVQHLPELVVVPQVEAGVEFIRRASLENLQSPEFIERELLPKLGLNNECPHEQPRSLAPCMGAGYGWRIWQYPNQFSKYLVFLSKMKIASYAEIGCRFGGTFALTLEYLTRFNTPAPYGFAVDLIEKSDFLKEYDRYRRFDYYAGDSRSEDFARVINNEKFDLALIDGDHSFDGVMSDFKLMRWRTKRIVFHDIVSESCPGVVSFWGAVNEFMKTDFEFSEFVEQYPDVPAKGPFLGIGVMRRT